MTTLKFELDTSKGRTNGKIRIGMAIQWAIDHCPSFVPQEYVLFDFKNSRLEPGESTVLVTDMKFTDPTDAVHFRLIWG